MPSVAGVAAFPALIRLMGAVLSLISPYSLKSLGGSPSMETL